MENEIDNHETDLAESMAIWVGFLEKTMKCTRPSNEHCNSCGLSFFARWVRGATLLPVCPSLLFLCTVLRLTLHLCMRFFSFCCGPFGWRPTVFEVDQSLPTMALCLQASAVVLVAWTA